jgi:hypothetical protein
MVLYYADEIANLIGALYFYTFFKGRFLTNFLEMTKAKINNIL